MHRNLLWNVCPPWTVVHIPSDGAATATPKMQARVVVVVVKIFEGRVIDYL